MYGLFPFVMHEVVERLANERPFSLDVFRDGDCMVLSMQFVDGVTVRYVIVAAVLTGEAWEDELLRVAARLNASFSSVPHVSSLVVEEVGRLVDCFRRDVWGGPVIVTHVVYAAVLDVILKSSQKTFVGFEPSSVLDPLQWRIESACRMIFMNKLPKLRSVSIKLADYWVHWEEGGIVTFVLCISLIHCFEPWFVFAEYHENTVAVAECHWSVPGVGGQLDRRYGVASIEWATSGRDLWGRCRARAGDCPGPESSCVLRLDGLLAECCLV